MSLSDDLKNAVQERGKSINSIAKAAGVPQPVLSRSINGERDIRLETASKLADVFRTFIAARYETPTEEMKRTATVWPTPWRF